MEKGPPSPNAHAGEALPVAQLTGRPAEPPGAREWGQPLLPAVSWRGPHCGRRSPAAQASGPAARLIEGAGGAPRAPPRWPQCLSHVGLSRLASRRLSRNRMGWYPGGGGPRRTPESGVQLCPARRRSSGQRGLCPPAEGKELFQKNEERKGLLSATKQKFEA